MTEAQANALRVSQGFEPIPVHIRRVAAEVGDEAAAWAFTQWSLRERARAKFARADEMLFTRAGLEMASHESVSALHAGWMPPGPIADLTAGIGGDLLALAARTADLVGLDTDPEALACARHNLGVHGLAADLRTADAELTDLPGRALFVDPMRRAGDKRTLDPFRFSPRLDRLRPRLAAAPAALIRLGPAIPDSFLGSLGGRVWFVSHARECCEALVALGDCGPAGGGAVRVEGGLTLAPSPIATSLAEPLAWVMEGDPAATRAGALGGFGLPGLGDARGYLTAVAPVESHWLRPFKALWSGPYRPKSLRTALRELEAWPAAVKPKGVSLDPVAVAMVLGRHGERAVVVLLYPVGRSVRAVIAEGPT